MKTRFAVLPVIFAALTGLGCQETPGWPESADPEEHRAEPGGLSSENVSARDGNNTNGPRGDGHTMAGGEDDSIAAASDSTRSPINPADLNIAVAEPRANPFGLVGLGKCGTTGCHGQPRPKKTSATDISQNELRVWSQGPHQGAFDALQGEQGQIIAKNLAAGGDVIPADEDPRCLACHSIPLPDYSSMSAHQDLDDILRGGVSCEACHGPAREWLDLHKRPSGWRNQFGEDTARLNQLRRDKKMVLTEAIPHRARMCAGCHIGAPPDHLRAVRDANHDIMAAGHPRLDFEMWSFHAGMPENWEAPPGATEKQLTRWRGMPNHWDDPVDGAQLWLAGQVASTEAALKLLAYRADPKNQSPWPEFAEYDCFACHHDLQEPSWRQERGFSTRVPGALPWGDWYVFTRMLAKTQNPRVAADLGELAELLAMPHPNRAQVAELARGTAKRLSEWLDSITEANTNPRILREWLGTFTREQGDLLTTSWDTSRQFVLALTALYEALPNKDSAAQFGRELERLYKALEFPDRYESPADFSPGANGAVLNQLRALWSSQQ